MLTKILSGPKNIGFVSTRFAGTDGVSLEAAKWAEVLDEAGHRCFWFAGELDKPAEISRGIDKGVRLDKWVRNFDQFCKHSPVVGIDFEFFDFYALDQRVPPLDGWAYCTRSGTCGKRLARRGSG